jgi:hypothetical protein
MKKKVFLMTAVLISGLAGAQDNPSDETLSDGTLPVVSVSPSNNNETSTSSREKIVDYKSVYEASSLEEEVQMAAARFELTKAQQDIWLEAATDRRLTENKFRDQANAKGDHNMDAAYRELRTSQNTFYETVIGYLSPAQKQKMEFDRNILNEKQKKLAKIPPPPPPTPTITAVPVDSAAIKESEKKKAAGKKSKKKKKAGA